MLVLGIWFEESREVVLLGRRAESLNDYYSKLENAGFGGFRGLNVYDPTCDSTTLRRIRWVVATDSGGEKAVGRKLRISLLRPFSMVLSRI
jgi:hypothetical protein